MSMTCLFREAPPPSPERKPNVKCVCSTIIPLESFMFSLFRLSSSAFCVSMAENVQNYGLCKSAPCCSTQCLSCARSKRAIPSWRTDRPTECVTDCLTDGERTDGQTDWLAGWLNDRLPDGWRMDERTDWLTYQLVDWLKDARTDGRPNWLAVSQSVRRRRRQTYGLTDWRRDWLTSWLTDWRTWLSTWWGQFNTRSLLTSGTLTF